MHTFLIVCEVLIAAVAGGFLWLTSGYAELAHKHARAAEGHEVRLKVMRTDVTALAAHVQALEHQLQRLQGRVYAQPRRSSAAQEQIERDDIAAHLKRSDDPRARTVGDVHDRMGVGIAVTTPQSCKCGYCETCLRGGIAEVRSNGGL